MKYVDEYRSGETAKGIAARIREEADPKREYRFMEFCGGHTHVLSRWGLGDILPESIRMIYSPMDAVKIARENPDRQVVFFAIGFETTTPPTAAAILAAKRLGLKNFSVFCCHVLTPAAM